MSSQAQNPKNPSAGLPVFIDRIEEDWAVITISDNDEIQFELPLKYLPSEVKAGDHLTLNFHLDPSSTEAARRRIAEMKKELIRKQDPDQKNFKL
jgi:hypothetical protein